MFSRLKRWKESLDYEKLLAGAVYVLGVILGISILAAPSETITQQLFVPSSFLYLWSSTAVIGGSVALFGTIRKDNLLIEFLGVQLLALMPLVYGLSYLIYAVIQLLTGATTTAMAVACLCLMTYVLLRKRVSHLKLRIRELKRGGE